MIDKILEFSANRFLVFLFIRIAAMLGWYSLNDTKLDAIPDLCDTQVIVYSRWDRSPDIMEDQVTYPIVSAMLGAPKVKDVRGFSDFGYSYVYVIFEDGTDLYWARSRTLEYLSRFCRGCRRASTPNWGRTPPAWAGSFNTRWSIKPARTWRRCARSRTGTCATTCSPCRAWPKWRRSAASSAQYQVNVDPNRLPAYSMPINEVVEAVRRNNNDVGGRLVEFTGREYMVRGRGYVRSIDDIGEHRAGSNPQTGTPSACATWARSRSARTCAAASPIWTARAKRRRHRHHAAGRERAEGDRARQGEARGDRAVAAAGRASRHRPTTARS